MSRAVHLFVCILLAALPAWCDQRYQGTGMVLAVDKSAQTVTISHDGIPGFMDAMVMPFHVREPHLLDNLQPATMIDFTLVVSKTSSYVTGIRVREYQSGERDPQEARRLSVLEKSMQAKGGPQPTVQVGQAAPNFTLVDQENHPVSLAQFNGKVVAVTFIYTRCPLPDYCLRLTNNFGRIQKRFGDRLGKDLILLSITFDPEHDRPEVLSKYAETWKANANSWHFLTGSITDVKRVCAMFGMNFWPDEGLLTHSLHTLVIDRQQKLVANLEGNQFTAAQLGDLIETVVKNPPTPKPPA